MLKERLETIIDAVAKGHILSDSELDRLLDYKSYPCEVQEQKALKSDDAYNIVYGNEGRIVRAKTRNQRRLVDEYYKGWWTNTTKTTLSSPSVRPAPARPIQPSLWL